jgi:hypothetical protein
MLAAHWLTRGYDSALLVELAVMSLHDGDDARRILPDVLAELGHPMLRVSRAWENAAWDAAPWRGHWPTIKWAREQLVHQSNPTAAVHTVLDVLARDPILWDAGGGTVLQSLYNQRTASSEDREKLQAEIAKHLLALSESDVPALTSAVGNGPPDVPALSQVSPAHPRFSAHFTAALYEDTAGEFTPFGTDEGADLLAVWTGQAADLTANPTVRHLLAGQVSDNSDVDAVFFDPLAAGDIDAAFTVVSAGFTLLRLTGRIDAEGEPQSW